MDRNASCTIMKCHSEHHGEEDYEQERCQDASLLGAIGNIKIGRHFAIFDNRCSHAVMERANDVDKAGRAADLQQNFPEGRPVDGVEGFCQIDKNDIQFALQNTFTGFSINQPRLTLQSCQNYPFGILTTNWCGPQIIMKSNVQSTRCLLEKHQDPMSAARAVHVRRPRNH